MESRGEMRENVANKSFIRMMVVRSVRQENNIEIKRYAGMFIWKGRMERM